MKIPGAKREERRDAVHDYLFIHGSATLVDIARDTGLTAAAVSLALRDIRAERVMQYATVATKDTGYTYKLAATQADMLPGSVNRAKDQLTRAQSWVVLGEKMTAVATTPAEFARAADISANAKIMLRQAQAIMVAVA